MKLPNFIASNLILKITSLNGFVIAIRLIISVVIQRLLAVMVGEAGIAKVGQIRNVMAMLTSISTLGVFNGVVKYLAEYKSDEKTLVKLFSTAFVFIAIGAVGSAIVLFFGATYLAEYLFNDESLTIVFKLLAAIVPLIAINRVFIAVVNGLSDYKKYAKIDLIGYVLSALALLIGLCYFSIEGVIIAIAITPIIQMLVLIFIFGKTLKEYIDFKGLRPSLIFKNQLLVFTLMSVVSTLFLNFVELELRTLITDKINVEEAGYWTAMTFISKNYMVFISGLLTLYVIPQFANIYNQKVFKLELLKIYKTILPLFGIGMVLIYLFRDLVIEIIYPDFTGIKPLFKWQLLGDFVRLCSIIIAHQFLAKGMVKSFVITEVISLLSFFMLALVLITDYKTEGVVIAHFIRYIIYLIAVVIAIKIYFKSQSVGSK
ncbi:O-antigen translocase [Winogradskyella sp. A3E31]|uniref:O-antigen translocase n=1 Tax=Winogradskyella sp. A3E31 TaxID=3349637 RepID=UPI00398A995B